MHLQNVNRYIYTYIYINNRLSIDCDVCSSRLVRSPATPPAAVAASHCLRRLRSPSPACGRLPAAICDTCDRLRPPVDARVARCLSAGLSAPTFGLRQFLRLLPPPMLLVRSLLDCSSCLACAPLLSYHQRSS